MCVFYLPIVWQVNFVFDYYECDNVTNSIQNTEITKILQPNGYMANYKSKFITIQKNAYMY